MIEYVCPSSRHRTYATMDVISKGLDAWFAERFVGLSDRPETIAYVAGVMKSYARPVGPDDMSRRSIVLEFADARAKGDFVAFQRIGDWVLWSSIVVPRSLDANREVVQSLGRLSYYTCHRILKGQWQVYEELADRLPTISRLARHMLV